MIKNSCSAQLHMMVGISGSGKTTYAVELENKLKAEKGLFSVERYSSDEWRERLYGSVEDQTHNKELFETLHKEMLQSLQTKTDVIFDATNVSRKDRMSFLRKLGSHIYRKAYIIAPSIETVLEQNWNREKRVPERVIWKQLRNFTCPFYWEGFDEIEIINQNKVILKTDKFYDSFWNFNQNSKWHSLKLHEHCNECLKNLKELTKDKTLRAAAAWHDVGKIFCESIDENRESHYYNHERISSYIFLTLNNKNYGISKLSEYERLFASTLIAYHMLPFQWNSLKLEEKYRRLMGDQFYESLILLHEADKKAH